MEKIKIGTYRHYKGFICEVIGIAFHSETLKELVIYRHDSEEFGKNALWARPKNIFLQQVNIKGELKPRFEFIQK
jgi:hypothetical protein